MDLNYASLERILKPEENISLSDEWSIGMIFYKLISNNNHPFFDPLEKRSKKKLIEKISNQSSIENIKFDDKQC